MASAKDSWRDQLDQDLDCLRECTYVEEADEISLLIRRTVESQGLGAQIAYSRFRKILEKYQEQSQLLDPHLESMITPLSGLLMKSALEPSSNSIFVVQHVSKLLWSIASVRGYKVVVKFFPNEAANLEPVVELLLKIEEEVGQDTERREESNSIWEAQCTLTLWLAQLVLIPFDLASVDSSISASATSSGSWPPIVSKIMDMYKGHLSSPGSIRGMAALLLGRLLTRPDLQPALDHFLQWSRTALHSEGSQAHFLIPGVTYALAAIFSTGQRKQLLPFASQMWTDAAQLLNSRTAASSVVARKFATKLVQRIGLTFLPATVAAWRYQQNSVSINDSNFVAAAAAAEEAEGDDLDIPEEIEEVIEVLLTGLQDKDTVVRWSAAKGLGRITSRLPQELGDDVLESVIELFSPKALQYDVRRGPHSVGAHVRDAAAYVCWAFARAYTAADMLESIAVLAPALLVTACYDREVNCRRAASAAYQESVGRQGNVPHGIDILTAADYFTLSSRTQAYLTVAPFIAQFPEYQQALADHLLSTKLSHWERSLRELTSKSLAALVPTQPAFLQTTAVDTLLPLCLNSILEVRHGAALGVGELTLALHSLGEALDTERQRAVAGVVPAIENARLYRGKGGELMRGAVCRLVECLALAKLPLKPAQHKQLHSSIDENLRHPTASIQSAACSALAAFTATYMPTGDAEAVNRTSDKYLGLLTDPNVAVKRGAAAALGALPKWLLEPLSRQILAGLAAATQVEEDPDDRDAETRVAAVKALALVAHKLYGTCQEAADCDASHAATSAVAADPAAAVLVREHVLKALLAAVEDYSTDNRGDIGSWVREAAVQEMPRCLVLLCTLDQEHVKVEREEQASITHMVIQALLKQSVERIARLREAALDKLRELIFQQHHLPPITAVQHLQTATATPEAETATMSSVDQGLLGVSALLAVPEYRRAVLEGLVASIGGLDASLCKEASAAFVQTLTAADPEGEGCQLLTDVAQALTDLWGQHARSLRLATPILRTAEVLLSQTHILALEKDLSNTLGTILDLTQKECQQCKDVPRLCAAVSLLCQLISCAKPVSSTALQSLLALMVNRYPKVRKQAAEQLYVRLMTVEDTGLYSEEALDQAYDVLTEIAWDGPLESVKSAKAQLLNVFELTSNENGESDLQRPDVSSTKRTDENASYQALINDGSRL
ncbi:hypothetical protein WJX82_009809 [Trebouxia sp. C0006]